MLVKYKYQTHSNCPRCGQSNEDTNHVIQCQGEGVRALWTAELTQLQEWMTKNKIHSEITELILDNLNHWRNNTRSSYKPSNSTLLLALQQQQRIG